MALQPKTVLETIFIRFTDAGTIQGIAAVDKTGFVDEASGDWVGPTFHAPAREIAPADLSVAAIAPALAAQQATIAAQAVQLVSSAGDLATAQAAAALSAGQVTQLQAQLAMLNDPQGTAAAAYFRTLDPAIQGKFLPAFEVIATLPTLADKVRAVQAITTADEAEAAAKAQLVAILSGSVPAPVAQDTVPAEPAAP